ncbi:hypothetical protein, partial [Acidocella aquatica]|uniref:hypothetical protein n=1 Tax=Acidocella aquatica TaxID=1922313 RepID=UPI0024E0EF46
VPKPSLASKRGIIFHIFWEEGPSSTAYDNGAKPPKDWRMGSCHLVAFWPSTDTTLVLPKFAS